MDTPSKRAKPSWWAEFKAYKRAIIERRGVPRTGGFPLGDMEAIKLEAVSRVLWEYVRDRDYAVPDLLKDALVQPTVANILATDDQLWATLFHRDYPYYDLMFGEDRLGGTNQRIFREVPAWVGGKLDTGDAEYDRVPWRRFYMWVTFFERTALRVMAVYQRNKAREWVRGDWRSRPFGVSEWDYSKLVMIASSPDEPTIGSFVDHPQSLEVAIFENKTKKETLYMSALGMLSSMPSRIHTDALYARGHRDNKARGRWCNLSILYTAATVEERMNVSTFLRIYMPSNKTNLANGSWVSILSNAALWTQYALHTNSVLRDQGASKEEQEFNKMYLTTGTLGAMPAVPRARAVRIDPGTGLETEELLLYVGGQYCSGDTCLNLATGASKIDGLHYCSKECQPIARFVDEK